jgi:hypothetical protein
MGQRGWNLQPVGGLMGLGISPLGIGAVRCALRSGTGMTAEAHAAGAVFRQADGAVYLAKGILAELIELADEWVTVSPMPTAIVQRLLRQMAGDVMACAEISPYGFLLRADPLNNGAARVETAAGRGLRGVRNVSFQDDPLALPLGGRIGNRHSRE